MKELAILQDRLHAMMLEADRREAAFRGALANAAPGRCPGCGEDGLPVDQEASIEESVRANTLVIIHQVCEPCMVEGATRDRLARYGVPRRVRHATFDNYETFGDLARTDAVASVKRWLTDDAKVFLILLGNCGTGKGHLASAAIRSLGMSAHWTSHADLVDGYYMTDFAGRPRYRNRFCRYPVLVIDEMGGKVKTADTSEIIFGIVDRRFDESLKTVIIGNIPLRDDNGPSILSLIGGERAASRLAQSSVVVSCLWEDYRRRRKA